MDINAIEPYVRSVFRFAHWSYANQYYTCTYDHRIFYFDCGDARVLLEERELLLPRDTILYVPCGVRYNIFNRDNEHPLTLYGANFDFFPFHSYHRDAIPTTEGSSESFFPEKRLERVDDPLFGKPFFVEGQAQLRALFVRMHEQYSTQARFYSGMNGALLKEILIELARQRVKGNASAVCEQVYAYIAAHYAEALTNRTIADALHYHPYYLSDRIRRETGSTLHECLMEYRIRMALVLLDNTELPVEEIAARVGFRTASHFTVAFRRITGTIPSRYREKERPGGRG